MVRHSDQAVEREAGGLFTLVWNFGLEACANSSNHKERIEIHVPKVGDLPASVSLKKPILKFNSQ